MNGSRLWLVWLAVAAWSVAEAVRTAALGWWLLSALWVVSAAIWVVAAAADKWQLWGRWYRWRFARRQARERAELERRFCELFPEVRAGWSGPGVRPDTPDGGGGG